MKLFLVKMSTGSKFEIEPEELSRVMEAMNCGAFVRVKTGVLRGDLVSDISSIERLYSGDGLGDRFEVLGNDKKLIK